MASMNELRAECARLGITPGRSIAECQRRIAVHQVEQNDRIKPDTFLAAAAALGNPEPVGGTYAEFAQAAIAEAPEPATPEEEQAMAEYSAEMRRMDAMGEKAWMAEQFKPRMSRLMRMLADTTAICGTLARNPLIYGGDQGRFIYAHREGVGIAARILAHRAMHPAITAAWQGSTTGRYRPHG